MRSVVLLCCRHSMQHQASSQQGPDGVHIVQKMFFLFLNDTLHVCNQFWQLYILSPVGLQVFMSAGFDFSDY